MKKSLIVLSLIVLITSSLATPAEENAKPPEYTADGLKLAPSIEGIDLVWIKPGIDLSQYKWFYLVEPQVAFRKNWQQDQNRGHPSLRVKASDMEEIKSEMAELLTELFTEELLGAGYTFSGVRAEGVMIIKTAILDLDINAPDIQSSGTSDTLAAAAGSMKLYLEIYDSVNEDILVRALDQTHDPNSGHFQSQKKVANRAAAKRMMTPWAKALSSGLGSQGDSSWQIREPDDINPGLNK